MKTIQVKYDLRKNMIFTLFSEDPYEVLPSSFEGTIEYKGRTLSKGPDILQQYKWFKDSLGYCYVISNCFSNGFYIKDDHYGLIKDFDSSFLSFPLMKEKDAIIWAQENNIPLPEFKTIQVAPSLLIKSNLNESIRAQIVAQIGGKTVVSGFNEATQSIIEILPTNFDVANFSGKKTSEVFEELKDIEIEIVTNFGRADNFVLNITPLSSTEEKFWFDSEFIIVVDGFRINLKDCIDLVEIHGNYAFVPYGNNQFCAIEKEKIEPILNCFSILSKDCTTKEKINLSHYILKASESIKASIQNECPILELLNDLSTNESKESNELFKGDLYPFQKEANAWLSALQKHKTGGILALKMGMGKMILSINHALSQEGKVLVVCPASILSLWNKSFIQFSDLVPNIYFGGNRHIGVDDKIVLTTYGVMIQDIEKLRLEEFSAIFFDEAQNLKNPNTISSLCACQLRADHKIALSGTFIENSITDLWSIMRVVNPAILKDYKNFKSKVKNTEELVSLLSPFIYQKDYEEVNLEMPELTETVISLDLSPEQKMAYETVVSLIKTDRMTILEGLLRLRQISLDRGLVHNDVSFEESAKIDAIRSICTAARAEGKSVLVFSEFKEFILRVSEHLSDLDRTYIFTGETKNRQELIDDFNENGGVMFISRKAGGVGLNVQRASVVIQCDPWWNGAREDQALGRSFRLGQTQGVENIRLISKDTIEEKILNLQEEKYMLNEMFEDIKWKNLI